MSRHDGRLIALRVCDKMSVVPKIIYKSVLKDLIATFFVTLAFLNAILMMEKMLRLSRFLSGVGATLYNMAKIVFYLQPQLLILTIPMAQLLSTLLVYGRMNQDSEIIILRASGMDFKKIAVPVLIFGFICFLSSVAVSFYLGPRSSIRLRSQITKTIAAGSARAVEEGTFNTSFKDVIILVKGKDGPDTLQDIFIYDNRTREEPKVLVAKTGEIFVQNGLTLGLYLTDGYINIMKGRNTTELFFDKYKFTLSVDYDSNAPQKNEFTPFELLKKTEGAADAREKASLLVAFHRRITLPIVCIALIFLGPPLSQMSGRSGRLGGLAIGLSVFTLYYVLLIYGENLVIAGRIPHYAGAWAPIGILGIFAVFLFGRENLK